MIKKIAFSFFVVTLLLAACAPSAPAPDTSMQKSAEDMADKSAESMSEKPAETMVEKSTDAEMAKPKEMMDGKSGESPAWFDAPLTDVRTGNNFTINGYKGKVILVETLAMWCPNCKKQQEQVAALHEMLGMNDDLVTIGLDVDKNEMADDLKAYTDKNGFDWVYAVAPAEVAREIGNLYGQQFLNPSSTPMLVVDRKGQAHPMPFGIKSAEDLKQFVEPFLNETM